MFIYLLESNNAYKIGVAKNIEKRIKNLQTGNANKINLVSFYETRIPFKIEKSMHNRYNWFQLHGEWFTLSDKDVEDFPQLCKLIEEAINSLPN